MILSARISNSLPRRSLGAALASLFLLTLSACGINSVPTAEEAAKARWADVEAQYQRRASLVDNLVATVRGAASHERETLTQVAEARAKASSVQVTTDDLNDPAKVEQFAQAQGALSQSLGRLLVTVERYPDLKANQNFLDLQSQLEGTENRISTAIIKYNESVQDYNVLVRTFPSMIGATIRGAKVMTPYKATTPNAQEAPKVNFDN